MWYLYLDESGDLGFDFVTKKPLSGELPYRFVVPRLWPTDGWEHLEQSIKGLCSLSL